MTEFDNIYQHKLVQEILEDSVHFDLLDDSPKEYADTEVEYYVNNSMFYLVHFISLLDQLNNAVELFSNYSYNQKNEIGRGKHLTYNYENFIIRLVSVPDRLLQVVNAIFYLGVNEKDVKERSILNNDKIVVTDLPKKYKDLNKVLSKYIGDRNKVIHRHSHIEKKLIQIEKFYHTELTKRYFKTSSQKEIDQFKEIRKRVLTDFIKKTKAEFRETNESCIKSIYPILDELHIEYKAIKKRLK